MLELSETTYQWIKTLHIISIICWMAGLLYLPRLFVYHAESKNTETNEIFKVMERRLYRGIMIPSLVGSWGFGMVLVLYWGFGAGGWVHAKLTMAVVMTACHFYLGYCRLAFMADQNKHSGRFYRFFNEVPTVLMLLMVGVVVFKSF